MVIAVVVVFFIGLDVAVGLPRSRLIGFFSRGEVAEVVGVDEDDFSSTAGGVLEDRSPSERDCRREA